MKAIHEEQVMEEGYPVIDMLRTGQNIKRIMRSKGLTVYLSTFEATKKWTMPLRNWGRVYGELQIMYEGRLPE